MTPAVPDRGAIPLREILKSVSRSFYLTLAVVPRPVRTQLGVAYLFARASDTIADTDLIEPHRRLALLKDFKGLFATGAPDRATIRSIQSAVVVHQASAGERALLAQLDRCFDVYEGLEAHDRARICRLMQTLVCGMEFDLEVFPSDPRDEPSALATMDDLDRYTYYVAGCVGEFWTDMACAHLPALRGWNPSAMSAVGARFGKGLQLTNIVKDIARDLVRGRCYVPRPLLEEVGLRPVDLLAAESLEQFRPVLAKLTHMAREHLDQGWLYTLAIPRRALGLRLACMWPILFAGHTLARVNRAANLLDPAVNVKMPKRQVYAVMLLTTATGGCGTVGTAYWGWVKKPLG